MPLTFRFFRFFDFSVLLDPRPSPNRTPKFNQNSVQTKPNLKYSQTKLLIRFGLVRCSVFHQITYTPRSESKYFSENCTQIRHFLWICIGPGFNCSMKYCIRFKSRIHCHLYSSMLKNLL